MKHKVSFVLLALLVLSIWVPTAFQQSAVAVTDLTVVVELNSAEDGFVSTVIDSGEIVFTLANYVVSAVKVQTDTATEVFYSVGGWYSSPENGVHRFADGEHTPIFTTDRPTGGLDVSPNGQWLAFASGHEDWDASRRVFVISVGYQPGDEIIDTSQKGIIGDDIPVNPTIGMWDASNPQWGPDGALYMTAHLANPDFEITNVPYALIRVPDFRQAGYFIVGVQMGDYRILADGSLVVITIAGPDQTWDVGLVQDGDMHWVTNTTDVPQEAVYHRFLMATEDAFSFETETRLFGDGWEAAPTEVRTCTTSVTLLSNGVFTFTDCPT